MNIMDQNEFLAQRGLSSPLSDHLLDKTKFPNGLTDRQRKQHKKESITLINDYHDQREAAIKEYQILVEHGILRPRTSMERAIMTANGHPDNASTQAARRICEKRGWNWKEEENL